MIREVIYLLVILAGIPNGRFLARWCSDELKVWRKRFLILTIISLALIIVVYFTRFEYKIPVIVALLFTVTTSLTIWKIRVNKSMLWN